MKHCIFPTLKIIHIWLQFSTHCSAHISGGEDPFENIMDDVILRYCCAWRHLGTLISMGSTCAPSTLWVTCSETDELANLCSSMAQK